MNSVDTLPKSGSFIIESYTEKLDWKYPNRNQYWFRNLLLNGTENKKDFKRKIKYVTSWKYNGI